MSLLHEAPGYLQVFSDGTVKRFTPEIASASPADPTNGFKSKDVVIGSSPEPITGRIYVPDGEQEAASDDELLAVIFYFHGGGFCIGSTSWLGYHQFLGSLSVRSKSIVLSVDYRLAPENKLPIAYHDCYSALGWVRANQKVETFLERSDLSRIFLAGDSAGGNIVHQVTIQSLKAINNGITIKGIMLIHPYFGSEKRTKLETKAGSAANVAMNDMFWRLSLPEGCNRDFYGCNFDNNNATGLSADEWLRFPAVIVFVAGLDFLKERGVMYTEYLRRKTVKWVELVEAEEEGHVFHVFHPDSEATRLLQEKMTQFMYAV
ncbi:unnamed protein product [Cuscuta campestris]|uniref:Alpha/beta hydrolase fold-3 domain-containing protein n=1 Tax=Cuscuta campestris TaxID=132261 RepID=A0A484K7N3_9ASTE|nr:unnamed protein product [Cuscuta campestris]